jgi:prephenate dehydrogenase
MASNQEQFSQKQLSQERLFNKINVIGLGLIGGSIAVSCKKHKISKIVSGFDVDKATIDFALSNNIIDELYDFGEISDNDLTIIAAPLLGYEAIFQKLSLKINKGILIDIGSLKFCVVSWAENILAVKAANFIACHPIAGSDKSGVVHSDADLFFGKKVIITPAAINSQSDIKKVELFWQKIGSSVEFLDAKQHDKIFALVSHLPQFLAFIATEEFKNGDDEILNKHFRLQNSNPKIWQEIFALNRENVEYYLQFYLQNLDGFLQNYGQQNDLISRRKTLVLCFLALPDIDQFKSFAGNGFKDFTEIINHPENQPDLDPKSLIEFFNQIKSRIVSYEFK